MMKTTWTKSRIANLVRNEQSGTYYARAKVAGKVVRVSLETKSESQARRHLPAKLAELKAKANALKTCGQLTMSEAAAIFISRVESNPRLKPRAKDYRRETLAQLRKTWSGFDSLDASEVTRAECNAWAVRAREHYSPTRFNGALQTLRAIFSLIIETGLRADDPSREVQPSIVPLIEPVLPDRAGFASLLMLLDNSPSRKEAANVVRVLAFTGLRSEEARHLWPEDIRFDLGRLRVRKPKGRPDGMVEWVPILPEAEPVLRRLLTENAMLGRKGPVLRINSPKKALATACKELGLPRLTPHKLRHLFAMRAIESGVDVPTVAAWLRHRDKGALLMKRYWHLVDSHSIEMASRVSVARNPHAEGVSDVAAVG